jgi:hypothetical protein
MKKITIAIVFLSILIVSACKKNTSVSGGSWTFKSRSYTVTSGIASSYYTPLMIVDTLSIDTAGVAVTDTFYNIFPTLTTVCNTDTTYSHMIFTFYSLPTASGSYTFTPYPLPDSGSHKIGVNMRIANNTTFSGSTYTPSLATAKTVTANVTVTNGMLKLAFQGLQMVNVQNPSDSAALSATVNQTQ